MIKAGFWHGKCPDCTQAVKVMRVGFSKLTCRCFKCEKTLKLDKPKPKKKKVKRPTRRTYAGLTGTCSGQGKRKEWRFTYPTKYMPLMLVMKKYMGYWDVWFGEMRMGSGKTMIEALEQAKRRMNNCGYELAKGETK